MQWNQNRGIFRRTSCPICGTDIPVDDGYGSFEMHDWCPTDRNHYRFFSSLFADSVTILGLKFDYKDVDSIEAWLDEVGNKQFAVGDE